MTRTRTAGPPAPLRPAKRPPCGVAPFSPTATRIAPTPAAVFPTPAPVVEALARAAATAPPATALQPAPGPGASRVATLVERAQANLRRAEALFAEANTNTERRANEANTPRRQEQAKVMTQREYRAAAAAAQKALDGAAEAKGMGPSRVQAAGLGQAIHDVQAAAMTVLRGAQQREGGERLHLLWRAKSSEAGKDFFPTPEALADDMVAMTGMDERTIVLEPSAGMGALLRPIVARTRKVFAVETDPARVAYLEAEYKPQGVTIVEENFLDWKTVRRIDTVVMNPPFTERGNPVAYVDHITHALELLRGSDRPGLVSLAPSTFNDSHNNRKVRELYGRILDEGGTVEDVPAGYRFGAVGFANTSIPVKLVRWGRVLMPGLYPLRAPAPRR